MINKEYIEREALLNEIQEEVDYELSIHTDNETKWMCGGLRVAMRDIRNRPTADVVPRGEVAKIFEEIDKFIRRYCNETHYGIGDMVYDIKDLEEKYTKGGER